MVANFDAMRFKCEWTRVKWVAIIQSGCLAYGKTFFSGRRDLGYTAQHYQAQRDNIVIYPDAS
eukprot:scaffold92719_cov14-Prasinocladus_malaysianus.AAC.1